jgi:hypothetical protein
MFVQQRANNGRTRARDFHMSDGRQARAIKGTSFRGGESDRFGSAGERAVRAPTRRPRQLYGLSTLMRLVTTRRSAVSYSRL